MDEPLYFQTDGHILTIVFEESILIDPEKILQIEQSLLRSLEAAEEQHVLLDLGRVKFLATLALGLLLRARKRCGSAGIALKVCNICPDIREVFTVTRLDTIFDLCHDEAAARRAFSSAGPKPHAVS